VPNVYTFKDFEGSSHRILIGLIRRFCARRGTMLDIGAAGGELGAEVRDVFDCQIAIEGDASRMSDLRSRYDQIVIGDLESTVALPCGLAAVVLADILEHLRDPRLLLGLVRRSIADDGLVFVSVPNIANITIRIGLLFGFFIYRDRGILDATHLRFYTLGTIRKEIEDAGFDVVAIRGSAVPIRLVFGSYLPGALLKPVEWILARATQLWKSLMAYQIILVARKSSKSPAP